MAQCRAMKHQDISSARRAIAALARRKHLRRYPDSLRSRLAALVRAHPEQSVRSLALQLGMAPQTLDRFAADSPAGVLPVRVVREPEPQSPTPIVRGPCGLVVEGLDVAGVADLLRALS